MPQEVDHNEGLTFQDAMKDRWHPKTLTSARIVPYDVSLRVELSIEQIAYRHDSFLGSRATVNRRIMAAAEEAGLDGRVYPHCIRATAASFRAYREVPSVPLQALIGWTDLSIAQKYIRISGTATAEALRHAHRR